MSYKLPAFRLGKGDELSFDKKDELKIRFYTKVTSPAHKYIIAPDAGSEEIAITGISENGSVKLSGGTAKKE